MKILLLSTIIIIMEGRIIVLVRQGEILIKLKISTLRQLLILILKDQLRENLQRVMSYSSNNNNNIQKYKVLQVLIQVLLISPLNDLLYN